MKTDVYGARAVWVHIHYLRKVSKPISEINLLYPYFTGDRLSSGFAFAQVNLAGEGQSQLLTF